MGVVVKEVVVRCLIGPKTVILKIDLQNRGCAHDVTLCEKKASPRSIYTCQKMRYGKSSGSALRGLV